MENIEKITTIPGLGTIVRASGHYLETIISKLNSVHARLMTPDEEWKARIRTKGQQDIGADTPVTVTMEGSYDHHSYPYGTLVSTGALFSYGKPLLLVKISPLISMIENTLFEVETNFNRKPLEYRGFKEDSNGVYTNIHFYQFYLEQSKEERKLPLETRRVLALDLKNLNRDNQRNIYLSFTKKVKEFLQLPNNEPFRLYFSDSSFSWFLRGINVITNKRAYRDQTRLGQLWFNVRGFDVDFAPYEYNNGLMVRAIIKNNGDPIIQNLPQMEGKDLNHIRFPMGI